MRQLEVDKAMINIAPGWLTDYDEEAPDAEARAVLDEMLCFREFLEHPTFEPLVAITLAFVILQEVVTPPQILGGACIITGVIVLSLPRRVKREARNVKRET